MTTNVDFMLANRLDGQPSSPSPQGQTLPLREAVELSQDVKQKVEEVVVLLGDTNDQVRSQISAGADFLAADKALAENERVESTVKEIAEDLGEVNGALEKGVEGLQVMEDALTQSRISNARIEARLVVSEQETATATAQYRAFHDVVTGLPNRALFDDRLVHAIAAAQRHGWALAVLFLDLNRFKEVNDIHGHAAGDLVLKEVSRRLAIQTRDEDTVCRYGGDEFAILLVNPRGSSNVARIADAISETLSAAIDVGGTAVTTGASIGVAHYPEDGSTGPALVKVADAAMYADKRSRR